MLQSFGEQADSLAVTPEDLEQIAAFAAEDKDMAAVRVTPQHLLHLQRHTDMRRGMNGLAALAGRRIPIRVICWFSVAGAAIWLR